MANRQTIYPTKRHIGTSAWLNGTIVEREAANPSVASISLHTGTAVFDGVMAYWNESRFHVLFGIEHFNRFIEGCSRMDLRCEWSASELLSGASQLLAACPGASHYLRPIAYRPEPEIRLVPGLATPTSICIFAVEVQRDIDDEVTCFVSSVRRVSSEAIPVTCKTSGVYVNSYLAQREAQRAGYEMALLLDRRGFLSEASTANIFFLRDGALVTPRLESDVFPGITRNAVIEWARARSIEVCEENIAVRDLSGFEGAFLCATLLELRPITRVGDIDYDTKANAVFRDVLDGFRALTRGA